MIGTKHRLKREAAAEIEVEGVVIKKKKGDLVLWVETCQGQEWLSIPCLTEPDKMRHLFLADQIYELLKAHYRAKEQERQAEVMVV